MPTRIDQIINLLLSPKRFWSGLVNAGASRINAISSVGYNPTYAQRSLVSPLFNYIQGQGLSGNLLFHHDPRVGLNHNFVRNSGVNLNTTNWSPYVFGGTSTNPTISIDTVNPFAGTGCIKIVTNGTFTWTGISQNIGSNTGTVTIRGRARGDTPFNLNCYYEVANNPSSSFAIGTAWQEFSFTTATTGGGVGNIYFRTSTIGATFYLDNLEVFIGDTSQPYNERTDATVLRLNNTVNNALGDGTFVNGTSANMTTIDATAGEVLNYVNTLSQGIQTAITAHQTDFTVIHFLRVPSLLATRVTLFKSVADWRVVIQTDGGVRLSTSSSVVSPAGTIVANTWVCIAVTVTNAGNVIIYKNGVQVQTGTVARSVDNSNPIFIGETTNAPFLGQIAEATLINTILTPTQILAIYNLQRSRYGL